MAAAVLALLKNRIGNRTASKLASLQRGTRKLSVRCNLCCFERLFYFMPFQHPLVFHRKKTLCPIANKGIDQPPPEITPRARNPALRTSRVMPVLSVNGSPLCAHGQLPHDRVGLAYPRHSRAAPWPVPSGAASHNATLTGESLSSVAEACKVDG